MAAVALPAAEPDGATFEADPPRQSAEDRGASPLLRLSAFEGRLDWLLELARARKVDLARLSLVEIADQLIAALDTAAADEGRPGAAPLLRRGEWVVMGAALAELRSRLLLPEDSPALRQARDEAWALRERLVERERMLAAADWLDGQAQLGRDVFGSGAPTIATRAGRSTDLTALLRACLAVLQAEGARGEHYRPEPLPLWRVPDAIARITQLLPELLGATGRDGNGLWRFLPDVAPEPPEYALRCRSAVASTLVAGLELAREGQITLRQEEGFGTIDVHGLEVAPDGQDAGAATGDAPACYRRPP